MRFNFHDVYFPIQPIVRKKRMLFVFNEEIGQRLINVCFALAQINAIVKRSHGRVLGPLCLPW